MCVCKLIDCNMKRFESDFVFINVPSCDSRRTYDPNSDPRESPNLDGMTFFFYVYMSFRDFFFLSFKMCHVTLFLFLFS